jgi:hypothetical protein
MTNYSIRYISSTEEEEGDLSIPITNKSTIREVETDLFEVLFEFYPELKIPAFCVAYEVHSAFPSWMGLDEDETLFANFQIEELP